MEWKEIKIASSDPPTKDTLENLQRSCKELADNISDPSGLGIVSVTVGSYTTTSADRIIMADSSGGKVTIVLQLPKFDQTLTIIKTSKANSVYVVTIDGKPIGNDGASIVVEDSKSFVATEKSNKWWRNGSA